MEITRNKRDRDYLSSTHSHLYINIFVTQKDFDKKKPGKSTRHLDELLFTNYNFTFILFYFISFVSILFMYEAWSYRARKRERSNE